MTAAPPVPSASVVLCAYTLNRWDDICAAVESLRRQTCPPGEVILVSDHNPALLDRARAELPGVTVLANAESRGLSGARNTGVAAATGEVVAFLDDDASADPGWLERLLEPYATPGVIGVYGSVQPSWRAPRPPWLPSEFLWVVGCSFTGQPAARAQVRNGIGANMSFRRDVFATVGPFDAGIGRIGRDAAGCEETEFSIRARRGRPELRILLEPAAVCHHAVTPDRVTRAYFRRRCRAEGRSKALVSRLAGADAALSSEREYVRKTLPRGVVRGLGEGVRGDVQGLARASTIVEGLALTASSYLATRLRLAVGRTGSRVPA